MAGTRQAVAPRTLQRLRRPWPDHRAELALGAVALLVCLCVLTMIVFVAVGAWPSFEHNGLGWFGAGGNVDTQIGNMLATSVHPPASAFHLRAWPILYGTALTTAIALALGLPFAVLASIFIVEFAPPPVRRVLTPVVRLLASVPSVIYGLMGILVLAPFVGNHVITASQRSSVQNVVELNGTGLIVAAVVLTVMITPIMVALITDALSAAPGAWREGAAALGVNRLRAIRAVTLRAIRPAIVAAAVLACARALGEAIMISMVSGSRAFSPKPIDGWIFFFEPLRTLASTIVDYHDGLNAPALHATLYVFALLLLFSALLLSVLGYLIKLPLRRYQVRG
jgi:phosphate transport system permease protein